MNRLLQLSTYGIKNIENPITLEFANSTIKTGLNKINNVKGIFGYNGAGKTALITSVDFYKSIVSNSNFLLQNDTKLHLDKLINFQKNEFFISMIFEYTQDIVIKHSILLKKRETTDDYVIYEEKIELSSGRTLNEKYESVITKKDNQIYINDTFKEQASYILNTDLSYISIIQVVVKKMLEQNNIDLKNEVNVFEKIILNLFASIMKIDVYLLSSDKHNNFFADKKGVQELLSITEEIKNNGINLENYFADDDLVSIEDYKNYTLVNKKLEKFIQVFKPELKEIKLILLEDRKFYHIRKLFVYENFNVELEYESSGIKQLVKLFTYLERCANGSISFIDEIDTNINTFYFKKLISFFKEYGNGQLIFTTHNVEAMDVLKSVSKSIVVLGNDNKTDTWVPVGNKSPINEYLSGKFPNSPMNIESFDFISIFQGDNE